MSKMSNLHAILTEQGKLPEYPDDSIMRAGMVFEVGNGDRYVATGRADSRGKPLLVGECCPPHLREHFEVPADGIELRHGPLTKLPTCDVCGEPVTDERPGGLRSYASGGDDRIMAHADH